MSDSSDTIQHDDPVKKFSQDERDLRPGADSCYKCSTCDTDCPVAAVDDSFPGPKFQGPEQWRFKRQSDHHEIDASILRCSNCMRCDAACPASVPLSQMHNTARGEYVRTGQSRLSMTYWRNRILANYRTSAWLASRMPRLANAVVNNRVLRTIGDRFLGITDRRSFPPFATETFREWFENRGGANASLNRAREARKNRGIPVDTNRTIAYFHGCYANYNTPAVGRALVRVYEYYGYAVTVPTQGCSGTPMFANGMLSDAKRHAVRTVPSMRDVIEDGGVVITSCTSCSMALRQEYPELFDIEGIDLLAANTFESIEYLRIHTSLAEDLNEATAQRSADFAYHAPCHARNQGLERQARELFADVEGITVEDVGDSCSGISGTYGWKSEKYDVSMEIGAEMFEHMVEASGERGMTECPTCAMQMKHGTGYEIDHPLEVIEDLLVECSGTVDG